MTALGGWVLTPLDGAWPPRLHELEEPPPVIFGLGSQASLGRPSPGRGRRDAAPHGPGARPRGSHRHPTRTGRRDRRVRARRGHRRRRPPGRTWRPEGTSVAVVGGGLDEPGPVAHRRLARRLAAQGAVISEQPPGVRPGGTFPRRNRIVSALAAGDPRRRGTGSQRRPHHGSPRAGAGSPACWWHPVGPWTRRRRLPGSAARVTRPPADRPRRDAGRPRPGWRGRGGPSSECQAHSRRCPATRSRVRSARSPRRSAGDHRPVDSLAVASQRGSRDRGSGAHAPPAAGLGLVPGRPPAARGTAPRAEGEVG